jgi:hypothetical protein
MTDTPKRPRGRPRTVGLAPPGASSTERKRAQRVAQQLGAVELPADVLAALDTLAQRHGDPSRAAAVARAVRMALKAPMPPARAS